MDFPLLQSEDIKEEVVRRKAGTVPVLFSLAMCRGGEGTVDVREH